MMMNNMIKDKKGFSSILFVTLALLIIEIIAIFMILLYKTYAFNEVQGIMDITGINTLYKTLNTDYFRDEYLAIVDMEDEEENNIDMNGDADETINNEHQANRDEYQMPEDVKEKLMDTYQNELNIWMANNGDGDIIEGMTVNSLDASIEYSTWGTGAKREKKSQLMMDGITEVRINSHLNMDPLGGIVHIPVFSSHSGGTSNYSIESIDYESQTGCYVVIVRSMVRLIIEN